MQRRPIALIGYSPSYDRSRCMLVYIYSAADDSLSGAVATT